MSKRCKLIEDITRAILSGGNAEELIPYDIRNLDDDIKQEMLLLYIKYGKNERRIEQCRNILESGLYETGRDLYL